LPPLVVGTRGSRLAMAQTHLVVDALRAANPDLDIEVRTIRTEGDRDTRTSLAELGGRGVFVKELEEALLMGEIDIAVHSLKDVPPELPLGLVIAAVPGRADPRDALVSRDGASLAALPPGARVGTGSARRAAQLLALRPDVRPEDIRGNVDTRLRRLDEGSYDAIIVAIAGLSRLGLEGRVTEALDPEVMTPAVGQGALAVEARGSDDVALAALRVLDDPAARVCVDAERAFLRRLGAGCRFPAGALASLEGGVLHLRGALAERPGAPVIRGEVRGAPDDRAALGAALAEELASRAGLPIAEVGA
jgi:hydroxymethylbilane synthase